MNSIQFNEFLFPPPSRPYPSHYRRHLSSSLHIPLYSTIFNPTSVSDLIPATGAQSFPNYPCYLPSNHHLHRSPALSAPAANTVVPYSRPPPPSSSLSLYRPPPHVTCVALFTASAPIAVSVLIPPAVPNPGSSPSATYATLSIPPPPISLSTLPKRSQPLLPSHFVPFSTTSSFLIILTALSLTAVLASHATLSIDTDHPLPQLSPLILPSSPLPPSALLPPPLLSKLPLPFMVPFTTPLATPVSVVLGPCHRHPQWLHRLRPLLPQVFSICTALAIRHSPSSLHILPFPLLLPPPLLQPLFSFPSAALASTTSAVLSFLAPSQRLLKSHCPHHLRHPALIHRLRLLPLPVFSVFTTHTPPVLLHSRYSLSVRIIVSFPAVVTAIANHSPLTAIPHF